MKIDLTGIPDTLDSATAKATPRVAANDRDHASNANDTATLSTGQGAVAALTAQVNQAPEIRQDKVAALAELVRTGNYAVTPRQTADAVIAHMTLTSAA
jgi:flagellar biosynthesis anti-sigma factor FlgM